MTEKGRYRIQTVAKMTGVPAATLRAWERRYGVPSPDRTSSAYRVYSDADVEIIRRLRELCDGGMAPAEAARTLLAATTPLSEATPEDDAWEVMRDRLVAGVHEFSPTAIEEAIRQSLVMGPATAVYEHIFVPAMHTVGEAWHAGDISIAQEHLASNLIESAVLDLLRLVQPLAPTRRAVLGCFAEEEHLLPVFGVAYRLCEWGFRVVMLGRRTPPSAVGHAILRLEPDLIGLSITVAPKPAEARRLVREYASACRDTPWLVGGRGAEQLRTLIEGHDGLVLATEDPSEWKARIEPWLAGRRGEPVH